MLIDVLKESWFWPKFLKILFLSAFSEIISIWSRVLKISILVEIVDSLDIGQEFWRVSIIVKIFENSRFWLKKNSNISIFVQNFENVDFA